MFINCVKNVLISKNKNAFDDIKVDVSFIPSLKALFSWSNAALFVCNPGVCVFCSGWTCAKSFSGS